MCSRLITKDHIKSLIDVERFYIDTELLITVCMIRLKNGHRVVTDAIVANREAFNINRGKVVARRKAYEEITRYEVYLKRNQAGDPT